MFAGSPRPRTGAQPHRERSITSAAVTLLPIVCVLFAPACQTTRRVPTAPGPTSEDPSPRPIILVRIPVAGARQADTDAATLPEFDPDRDLPVGSHIVRFQPADPEHPTESITNLTPGFASAGRPDISFDGKRILFVAKRTANDRFRVWEMNIDGTGLKQITSEAGPCSAAIYLSTIFTMDANRPLYRIGFSAGPADPPSVYGSPVRGAGTQRRITSLYTCLMDGRRVRRITFAPDGTYDPYLLSDGRLLFGAPTKTAGRDGNAIPGSALFTVNTDGTDVSIFADADQPAARRGQPCETSDGWVVYVESKGNGWDRGGSLVAVRRARSLHHKKLIAGGPEELFQSPSALPDRKLLVSYRRLPDESYGVYVLDPAHGKPEACLIDSAEWHEVDAHPAGPRPVPKGRSSVVDERVDTGFLYCMNAYLSDTELGRRIEPGRIESLQLYRAVEEPDSRGAGEETGGGSAAREVLLGEVPVESDGSFFVEVPAGMPLRLKTLDADGEVLQEMQSWIWVMPKEARGCIGCHEDRELTPANVQTRALRKAAQRVGAWGEGRAPASGYNGR